MLQSARGYVLAILLGVLMLSGNSCREEPRPVQRVPARLQIKGALPDFPAHDVYPPNYVLYDVDFPTSLRFDLNEPAHVDEITVSFFPAAEPGWSKRASTTSGIFWLDAYQPDQNTWMQRILIDGPRFARPWLQEFLVKERPEDELGLVESQVFHRFSEGPALLYTLMLFYDDTTAGGVLSPVELFDLQAQSAVLANFELHEPGEQRAMRMVDHLERGTFYTMAAILDTNGDGIYDPELDWWGAARVIGSASWEPRFVPAGRGGLEEPLFLLEAEMLPPPAR